MNYLRHLILTYDKKQLKTSQSFWFSLQLHYTKSIKFGEKPLPKSFSRIKLNTYNFMEHFKLENQILNNFVVNNTKKKLKIDLNEGITTKYKTKFNFSDEFIKQYKKNEKTHAKFENYIRPDTKSYFVPRPESDKILPIKDFISPSLFLNLNTEDSSWDSEKYFLFKKGNRLYTVKNTSYTLLDSINIYFLRKERLYTKLKYSRVPAYDIVSGGFALFLAAFFGFLILEKFGHELPDSGDFWYLIMYVVVLRLIYKAIAFGINKENTILYIFSLKTIWFYLYNLFYIIVTSTYTFLIEPFLEKSLDDTLFKEDSDDENSDDENSDDKNLDNN